MTADVNIFLTSSSAANLDCLVLSLSTSISVPTSPISPPPIDLERVKSDSLSWIRVNCNLVLMPQTRWEDQPFLMRPLERKTATFAHMSTQQCYVHYLQPPCIHVFDVFIFLVAAGSTSATLHHYRSPPDASRSCPMISMGLIDDVT